MAHKQILLLNVVLLIPPAYGMEALLERQKEDKALDVVLVHGFFNDDKSLADTKALLQEMIPGTTIHTPSIGFYGCAACEEQVQELTNFINSKPELKKGFNLVGYSLGGLIARATLQEGRIPRVYSLITLASPHRGVCGLPGGWNSTLDSWVDKVDPKTKLKLEKRAEKVFYLSSEDLPLPAQVKEVVTLVPRIPVASVVDIWNEPSQQKRYLKYNTFLPYVNNEKSHRNDATYRHNLTTALAFLALSGSGDKTVRPWQSTRFDYVDGERTKVVSLEETPIFTELGLKDLGNKFKRVTIEGQTHGSIHKDRQACIEHVGPALSRESVLEYDSSNVYEEATTSLWRKCICCK